MKDIKVSLLILISCLLLMAAFIVLWTWGYHSYYKKRDEKRSAELFIKDSIAIVNGTRDSLQKLYTATLIKLNTSIDSTYLKTDSIRENLDRKLREIYKLSDQIALTLKIRKPGAYPSYARRQIAQLKEKAEEFRNGSITGQENNRTVSVLQEVPEEKKITDQVNVSMDNNPGIEKTMVPSFAASDLKLSAIRVTNERELETTHAESVEKFIGSFAVKNNINQSSSGEMVVVVLQPDGKVLQKSTWESGSFTTREGKKIYSLKMNIESAPREAKRLNFSLSSDRYQKGSYILQIYHNGRIIGKATKILS